MIYKKQVSFIGMDKHDSKMRGSVRETNSQVFLDDLCKKTKRVLSDNNVSNPQPKSKQSSYTFQSGLDSGEALISKMKEAEGKEETETLALLQTLKDKSENDDINLTLGVREAVNRSALSDFKSPVVQPEQRLISYS